MAGWATGGSGGGGKSAYDIWLEQGNVGTEQDFLNSLRGPQGPAGPAGGGSGSSLYPYYVPDPEEGADTPEKRVYKGWTAVQLYAAWDALAAQYPAYITKQLAPYKDMSGEYDLARYIFAPEHGYEKTIYIGAGVHGSEYANKLAILRFCQIICEKWQTNPQLSYLRHKVRMVIIPMINPWGHDHNTLVNANGSANTNPSKNGTNCNRNYDSNWNGPIASAGSDHNGAYPFSENETKWVRDTLLEFGPENFHYAFDLHDAPSRAQHGDLWVNYNTLHDTSRMTVWKLIDYLDAKWFGGTAYKWHVADSLTTGHFMSYASKTLGIPASTVECTYDLSDTFDSEFMTRMVDIIGNTIIVNAIENHKSPVFTTNESWFGLQYWRGAWEHNFHSVQLSFSKVVELWDALVDKHPNYAAKSDTYVTSADGYQVHHYIFSPKRPKKTILFVGGRMIGNKNPHRFSYATLRLADLLCVHGHKDPFLSYIRNNVRVVIVPYLEWNTTFLNTSGNFTENGTPKTTATPVANIISIMDSLGDIDGVIYQTELNDTDILTSPYDDVFTLASQDVDDLIDITSYADYLREKGLSVDVNHNAIKEFGNYVFNQRNIPVVRIDAGFDRATYEKYKNHYTNSTSVVTISAEWYGRTTYEVARRISHFVNVVHLMCRV